MASPGSLCRHGVSASPVALQFLDESQEIRAQYDSDFSPFDNDPPAPPSNPSSRHGSSITPSAINQVETPPPSIISPTEGLTVLSLLNSESPGQTHHSFSTPPALQVLEAHRPPSPRAHHEQNTFVHQQPAGLPIFWPLEHEQEAMLLGHYIDNVALFFDMIDDRRHFGNHVVQRAKKNSTLMNAILALSARHLSRTCGFDAYVADAYYQRCFETLIPALNDTVAIRDESLLAATILLRLMEEMNISILGSDPQGHLLGTQAIIRAAEQQYAGNSGPDFRQAIYWAAFRQELWISLMTQRPFQLHIFPTDRSLDPANDSIWATRTIAHLGEVCNFAFGEDRHNVLRYNQLMDDNAAWRTRRPESFEPYFFRQDRDGSGRDFPDIRFHEKTHVMGTQYNTLARVLLVVHNPTIPQLGPSHKQSRQNVDRVVQEAVRTLCGVALSNAKIFPCKFVACFAIALVGDRFSNHEDQKKLHDILLQTESAHGFPPTATIHLLEEAWGWANS
ncbi:hypothetical protein BU24DRAFT_433422 [Aaosphaeria arxii CBS 175.79]|uniref:Transcription factor domain-containing protein n=1 Tax=Aaosphaeria arxii CBS 175.79 TaxID=1450172 RepID=A0A6A5XUU3_9PLEO|nr:uncharacterized protein BU24DRAFT_433422 [Aaosphaeria arxii CBS 175.79]KAF2016400.1 hypothetical protein BU24DRAFT_433422 [Aaosphaeria arxii CBS 175.79]